MDNLLNERTNPSAHETPHEILTKATTALPAGPVRDSKPPAALEDMSTFNTQDPRSLINLLPRVIRDLAVLVPIKYFEFTEQELEAECFQGVPAFDDARRIRISFWNEYDRVQQYGERQMKLVGICAGVCTEVYLTRKFITNQRFLAWILRPPPAYVTALSDIHDIGLRQMLAISQLPIQRDDKGNFDVKLMTLQKAIHDRIDSRLKGAIAVVINQNVDQRNLNVNVAATPGQAKNMLGNSSSSQPSMEEVESRIRQLEQKSVLLQAPSQVTPDLMRDVSPPVPIPIEVDDSDDEVEP